MHETTQRLNIVKRGCTRTVLVVYFAFYMSSDKEMINSLICIPKYFK